MTVIETACSLRGMEEQSFTYESKLFFEKLVSDVIGPVDDHLVIRFRAGSIRSILVPGKGRLTIPKNVDRKGASQYLPCTDFDGTLDMDIVQGTPVTCLFTQRKPEDN